MVMARGEARGRVRLVELLDLRPGMRVLDLACGPGTLTARLAQLVLPGGEVLGVDLAPGMIELARAAGIDNARFEVMDMERLLFPDASFDSAACGHGIQFAPDLSQALREARRVLRPGARFAASVPLQGIQEPVWALLDTVLDRRLPPAQSAIDGKQTRDAVSDAAVFAKAALDACFATASVELIEEKVHWESAEQLVSLFTSWWDCSSRMEGMDADRRQLLVQEATATLRAAYPGAIETTGHNHVLFAVAG